MKALFLCKRYYTSKDLINDRFGRLFHIPMQFSYLGVSVSVIALDYRNARATDRTIDGVSFRGEPATPAQWPSLAYRLRKAVRQLRPDVIIASGDSHIGFMARFLASSVGAKFVFDVYDYYPAFKGNRIPGMGAMFASALRQADVTFCASYPLVKRLSGQCKRTILIENGVDRELFFPRDKHSAREELGVAADATYLGYFGSINSARGPLLFEAVDRLRGKLPNVRILLAGKVSDIDLGHPSIIYRGEVPHADIPALISASDVVTIPYASDSFNDMAGPCKIAEYLACERPVVATRVAGQSQVFQDAPNSLCEPDAVDMARALEMQIREPQLAGFPEQLAWSYIGLTAYRAIGG